MIKPEDLARTAGTIRRLSVASNDDTHPVTNKAIHHVTVKSYAGASFENCHIGILELENDSKYLDLINTWVDHLVLRSNLASLAIRGGGILRISCKNDQALIGDARVSTFFPRFKGAHGSDLQPLRNLRKNLNALHNNKAAGFFHAVELSLSRRTDSWVNRRIGWIYEVMSDFGNSTTRPIVWLLTSMVFTFGIAVLDNNLVATTDINPASWQQVLDDSQFSGRLSRAALYPFTTLNPLGFFSSKALVQVGPTWWIFAYVPLTLLGITSLALFFLSLRRRFRLE